MMRSIPPASSLLAEMPVPAPPPMIGSPRATLARRRFRMPERELSVAGAAFFDPMVGPLSGKNPTRLQRPAIARLGSDASLRKRLPRAPLSSVPFRVGFEELHESLAS